MLQSNLNVLTTYLPTYLPTVLPTPTYLLTYLVPTYLPTYLPTCSTYSIYLLAYLLNYLPTYLAAYLPIYSASLVPTYLPTYLTTYLSTYLRSTQLWSASENWVWANMRPISIPKKDATWTPSHVQPMPSVQTFNLPSSSVFYTIPVPKKGTDLFQVHFSQLYIQF